MNYSKRPRPQRRPVVGLVVGLSLAAVVLLVIVALVLTPILSGTREAQPGASLPPVMPKPSASSSSTPAPRPIPSRPKAGLNRRVLFGFQSVGGDIAKAISPAFSDARLPKPTVISWGKAQTTHGPLVATATIGRNGNPRSKLRAFAGLVNSAPRDSIDVAIMMFNYQDVGADTDVDELFQAYVETMASLVAASPDVAFLYATVPVTTANSWRETADNAVGGLSDVDQPLWQDNIARERFNALVRREYAGTGRLFDTAALQARLGKGKVAAKQHEGQWYYVMNPSLSSDGRRLNGKGATQLATSLMALVESAAAG